jgi:hypothetical protein
MASVVDPGVSVIVWRQVESLFAGWIQDSKDSTGVEMVKVEPQVLGFGA